MRPSRVVLSLLGWSALAILVAALLFVVMAKLLPAGEQIAPAVRDEAPWQLPPERLLRAQDLDELRLPVAIRGYRFAETDLLLDRVAEELRARDAELARLREELATRPVPQSAEVSGNPADAD